MNSLRVTRKERKSSAEAKTAVEKHPRAGVLFCLTIWRLGRRRDIPLPIKGSSARGGSTSITHYSVFSLQYSLSRQSGDGSLIDAITGNILSLSFYSSILKSQSSNRPRIDRYRRRRGSPFQIQKKHPCGGAFVISIIRSFRVAAEGVGEVLLPRSYGDELIRQCIAREAEHVGVDHADAEAAAAQNA